MGKTTENNSRCSGCFKMTSNRAARPPEAAKKHDIL
jgi:hypothetical protein